MLQPSNPRLHNFIALGLMDNILQVSTYTRTSIQGHAGFCPTTVGVMLRLDGFLDPSAGMG